MTRKFIYNPRDQFMPYHNRTQRYACVIAHRRAGKSYALLNDIIVRALTPRADGLRQQFALMAPTQSQARSIAWAYLKEQTACFAHCPGYKALEQHLTITLPSPVDTNQPGATIMLVGAENAERLRGLFMDGICIDEAADIPDYVITQIIRPTLADRQGWMTISGTVKSIDDYLWRTYELSLKLPKLWFSMNLKASESGILPAEELEDLRRGMTEENYQVEFENNVQAAVTGRILLPYLNPLQVTRVPYDPAGGAPFSGWDLGISDAMAVWVAQQVGREVRILDYTEESGKGLDHFVDWLRKRPYSGRFGAHLLPHDTKVRELGNGGKTRLQSLRDMGMRNIKIVPKLPKDQQIDAGRMLLPKCWFNEDTTEVGRRALRNYSFEFDPKRKVFSRSPLHDQYSNGCLVAGTMIATTRGDVPIEAVRVGDRVITPSGSGLVTCAGPTKRATELIRIRMSDGCELIGTPEHKVFTRRGLIQLHEILEGDSIITGGSFLWRLFIGGARKTFLRLYALTTGR